MLDARALSLSLLSVIAVVAMPAEARAQTRDEPQVRGLRERRANLLPPPFATAWVAATDDGLVEFAWDDRLGDRRWDQPRESIRSREFYAPAEVLDWVSEVTALLGETPDTTKDAPARVARLGREGGVVLEVRGSSHPRRPLSASVHRCQALSEGFDIDPVALAKVAAELRRAARDAQNIAPARPPDDAVWYEHAVSCPAVPEPTNTPPAWPRDASLPLRPHQELMQFVVSASGAVEVGTLRFLPTSDPRVADAIRQVVATWRFTPAVRMGRPVRQLAHLNVTVWPPVVFGRPGEHCPGPVAVNPGDGYLCDRLFAAFLDFDMVTVLPQGDGKVRIATYPETRGEHLVRERFHLATAIPEPVFRRFIDSLASVLPRLDTTGGVPGASDLAPGAPSLGMSERVAVQFAVQKDGTLFAGFDCGGQPSTSSRFFAAGRGVFPELHRAAMAALDRVPLQPRWAARGDRPYLEQELLCDVARRGPAMIPLLEGPGAATTSVEVIARLIVDSLGRVEPASIQIMPGADSMAARLMKTELARWLFRPGAAEGRYVRAETHVKVVLRPRQFDALTLALAPPPAAADTIQRTIFHRSLTPPDRPAGASTPAAWRAAVEAMQPYVDRARATWPSARARFLRGLALGARLLVTTRITDPFGRSEQSFILVDRITEDLIEGTIDSEIGLVTGWRRGDQYVLREGDLIDWTIVHPDGREEGNVVGKFLDTYRPPRVR